MFFPESIFTEICLFLPPRIVFLILTIICKNWYKILCTQTYKTYFLQNFFKLPIKLPYQELIHIFTNTKKNKILNFLPWKTNAGIHPTTKGNKYENMWEYNGTIYSTYSNSEKLPLKENCNCLGTFAGGYQTKKRFSQGFHNDVYNFKFFLGKLSNRLINIVTDKDQYYSMILNPLRKYRCKDFTQLNLYSTTQFFHRNVMNVPDEYSLPVSISENIAIISKIALARPLLSMGPVRTLLICINETMEYVDYSYFDAYNNCKSFESAACFGNVLKYEQNNRYQYIEFLSQPGFYPLLWVQFLKDDYNHLEIELSQARIAKVVNVKFCDINDRRNECRLGYYYPNFDITYALFIGYEKVLENV
ncbi:hypothetical protein SteCoe_18920 [Stentor coeruleus]|uniref:F-box domain-containing protein n=1 Tax=Stentor coeruleus TaxID=5963 RepID=A0A1R2BVP0_9CILI|nr:hypothetical protein SteCoe_18920 [Stentor coeruleus]